MRGKSKATALERSPLGRFIAMSAVGVFLKY